MTMTVLQHTPMLHTDAVFDNDAQNERDDYIVRARLAWTIVWLTVFNVVWGAWVRISGSGDGCGKSWPLCQGEVIPEASGTATWIELSHRVSTGCYGLLVVALLWQSFRHFNKGHPARFWAVAVLCFTILEALIGAKLVLFGLVADSEALARMIVMPLHLVNTALLLTSAVICAMASQSMVTARRRLMPGTFGTLAVVGILLLILLTTGAIAALGVHIAPAMSVFEGLSADVAQAAHPAVRLRLLHPILALVLVGVMPYFILRLKNIGRSIEVGRSFGTFLIVFWSTAMFGMCTLLFLSPVWMKLGHLALANIVVITLAAGVFRILYRPTGERYID